MAPDERRRSEDFIHTKLIPLGEEWAQQMGIFFFFNSVDKVKLVSGVKRSD